MNRHTRLLALLLSLLLIFPLLASCAVTDENSASDRGTMDILETEDNHTTVYVKEEYADYHYDGYEFRIMSPGRGGHYYWMLDGDTGFANEVWYEEDSAEPQQHSVYMRNTLAEELLDIKIKPIFSAKLYWEMVEPIKTLIKSGGDEFDMILSAHTIAVPIATEGYYLNLLDFDTLNLKNEWWDQEYNDTFTYQHQYLYTTTGDYSIFDDYALATIFYNKQMVLDSNLTDPADLVEAGTWTLDAFAEMCSAVTRDSSGDGKMDINDTYGFYDNTFALTHLMEGCNIHIAELDEEGVPQVIIEKEEFTNAVQAVYEKIVSRPFIFMDGDSHDKEVFKEDRALFAYEQLAGINMLRDMESDYSLLPLPKKDLEQDHYTCISNGIWQTVLSVPITGAANVDRTGVIMEVLSGFSTDTVDAALHEIVLGPKLFREQRSRVMLDYIINSGRYDWAKELKWAYSIYHVLADQGASGTFTLASSIQRNLKLLKSELRRFVYPLAQ